MCHQPMLWCEFKKCWFCQALPGVCTRGAAGKGEGQSWAASTTDPQQNPSEAGDTSVKRQNPAWQERKMREKKPQLLEKTGWSWFSWQAGTVACRAHTGARERCEEEVVKRKWTLWLQLLTPHPLGWGTGNVGTELSLEKGGGQDWFSSCLCFSPSNAIVIGNKLTVPKVSLFCLWWEIVSDFPVYIWTHEFFYPIFSPDLWRMGRGWGAGWASGHNEPTTGKSVSYSPQCSDWRIHCNWKKCSKPYKFPF